MLKENKDVCRRACSVRYGAAGLPHGRQSATLLRSMWERGWSFIKKAGTIILLSTILVWFIHHTSAGQTARSECSLRTKSTTSILANDRRRYSACMVRSSAGVTGRLQLLPLPGLLRRKTSLVLSVYFTAAETQAFIRTSPLRSRESPRIRSLCSTCFARPALRLSALSSVK